MMSTVVDDCDDAGAAADDDGVTLHPNHVKS